MTVAGAMETAGFTALEAGGIVLSSTGVGAAVGAPATAIAAMGATHGATLAATEGSNFVQSAKELYQRMSRSEGVSGKVVKRADETEKFAKGTGNIISDNMKTRIPNNEIFAPNKRGNAPISKKDNRPIEIHHEGQNPNGSFHEMHASDHRFGENYKKNHPSYNEKSGIDRKQFIYMQLGSLTYFFDCRRQAKGLPASRVRVTENRTTSRLPDKFICLGAVLFDRPTVEKC
ncbi:HNH/ENDO VII family nuclease [Anoxybacteroides amylolyticum]|uniref:LHH domain-containing protein n=1 Tax=Anoxybacteroides amylolyticum TaxID=294699 RepID=A0A160F6X3_9BACL|nr:HNH/ENDO VII family nuclease [Anoxybacillus amylolyticus]ANB62379.1 hypothetical protein GFC30_3292 [Anoxybacillus amylolyticus]